MLHVAELRHYRREGACLWLPRHQRVGIILPTNITPSLVFSAATATPSLVFSAATAIPSFAFDKPFINTSILAELLWRDGA